MTDPALDLTDRSSRRTYISYLHTETLVAAIADCDDFISTARRRSSRQMVELWLNVKDDLEKELRSRQMQLPESLRPAGL